MAEAVEAEQRPPELPGVDLTRLDEETFQQLDEWKQPEEQPQETELPSPDYVQLEEERQRHLNGWRRRGEEQRRETEELDRRKEKQEEEGTPEST